MILKFGSQSLWKWKILFNVYVVYTVQYATKLINCIVPTVQLIDSYKILLSVFQFSLQDLWFSLQPDFYIIHTLQIHLITRPS